MIKSVADGRREQRFWLATQYFSWRKFWNLIRVEVQVRFGRRLVWGSPYEWEIDTTNICQLKCPLCHTGKGTIHRDQGVMDFGLFTSVVDQIKHSCMWLTLYSWGEPFLNLRIHEYIEYAHKQKIATIISSNLNKPLTPEMAEQVIRSGLDVLIVSLDGVTQDVYEIYRVTGILTGCWIICGFWTRRSANWARRPPISNGSSSSCGRTNTNWMRLGRWLTSWE